MGSVAKSYVTTASSYMVKYLRISSHIRKPFLIYDFATDPIEISLYMRKTSFSFLSVQNKLKFIKFEVLNLPLHEIIVSLSL